MLVLVVLTALLAPVLPAVPLVFADQAIFFPAVLAGMAAVAAIVVPVFAAVLPPPHAIGARQDKQGPGTGLCGAFRGLNG